MLIKQDNLTIRNATPKDSPILGSWWRDGDVMAHAGFPLGLSVTDEEIEKQLLTDSDDTYRRLIIELDNTPIGEMSCRNKGNSTAEIGIKICDFSKQEKGYGTKIIRMLIGSLFSQYGYDKVILNTNLNNKLAQRVYEAKLGFRKVSEQINAWTDQLGRLNSVVNYELTRSEFEEDCRNHWYAYIYEQQLIQRDEVDFILDTVGKKPQNILEVACGGGRILYRLADFGHDVTGFDMDRYMLERCEMKLRDKDNARWYQANALSDDWGKDYDVVILAGNILINIVTKGDYNKAQQLFIKKAAEALKLGGHLYLDFDCFNRGTESTNGSEWTVFEGTDDRGTFGRFIVVGKEYDPKTRMDKSGFRRFEIKPLGGELFSYTYEWQKAFPTLSQVHNWLEQSGFTVLWEYGGYNRCSINEDVIGNRSIIWAERIK